MNKKCLNCSHWFAYRDLSALEIRYIGLSCSVHKDIEPKANYRCDQWKSTIKGKDE